MEAPMGDDSLYDEDVLAWAEQQAAALRRLGSRRDLPNELDLSNVIEEIEDVGKSEFHAVESLIENILIHLMLLWVDPGAPATRGGSQRSRPGMLLCGGASLRRCEPN
jgi:Domain of unknown function DUF29